MTCDAGKVKSSKARRPLREEYTTKFGGSIANYLQCATGVAQ